MGTPRLRMSLFLHPLNLSCSVTSQPVGCGRIWLCQAWPETLRGLASPASSLLGVQNWNLAKWHMERPDGAEEALGEGEEAQPAIPGPRLTLAFQLFTAKVLTRE